MKKRGKTEERNLLKCPTSAFLPNNNLFLYRWFLYFYVYWIMNAFFNKNLNLWAWFQPTSLSLHRSVRRVPSTNQSHKHREGSQNQGSPWQLSHYWQLWCFWFSCSWWSRTFLFLHSQNKHKSSAFGPCMRCLHCSFDPSVKNDVLIFFEAWSEQAFRFWLRCSWSRSQWKSASHQQFQRQFSFHLHVLMNT